MRVGLMPWAFPVVFIELHSPSCCGSCCDSMRMLDEALASLFCVVSEPAGLAVVLAAGDDSSLDVHTLLLMACWTCRT
jgi:hypothetical protein